MPPRTVVCFPLFSPRRMWLWCLLIDKLCADLLPVSRTKGHSKSTSLLGARPKPCTHCFVLAETGRFCGTCAEGLEYHDLRNIECLIWKARYGLAAGTLIETSACSALSRKCALAQLRTGTLALLFPFLFPGHSVVALVLSPWSVFSAHSSVLTLIRLVCMAHVKKWTAQTRARAWHISLTWQWSDGVQTSGAIDQLD